MWAPGGQCRSRSAAASGSISCTTSIRNCAGSSPASRLPMKRSEPPRPRMAVSVTSSSRIGAPRGTTRAGWRPVTSAPPEVHDRDREHVLVEVGSGRAAVALVAAEAGAHAPAAVEAALHEHAAVKVVVLAVHGTEVAAFDAEGGAEGGARVGQPGEVGARAGRFLVEEARLELVVVVAAVGRDLD